MGTTQDSRRLCCPGLPNEPLWVNLLERATTISRPILRDTTLGIHVSLTQLLADVVHMRQVLWDSLPSALFDDQANGIINESSPYIGLSTAPNYEFYVASLAILAVGGAIVPLRPELPVAEELQVLKDCKAVAILTGPQQMSQCGEIKTLAERQGYRLQIIPLAILTTGALDSNPDFTIDARQTIPPTRPSLVIRTTGTTGGPKSVVHTRRLFHRAFPSKPDDLILIHENLDWISGSVSIMMRVLGGAAGEVLPTNPGPAAIWERLRRGGVTSLTDHSWFWEGLARHFRLHIAVLPDKEEREEYVRAARSLRWAFVVGTPPPPSLLAFWEGTFGAKLQVGYVATELGAVALSTSPTEPYVEGSLGRPLPGITAKLSQGDHGELLVKTPYMFSHYIGNEAATKAAFDPEGYFKTGDAAHLDGDKYVFDGRIGSDILDVGARQISLLRLDHKLTELPYISEVYTLCVPPGGPGTEGGNQLGALVRFKDPSVSKSRSDAADLYADDFRAQLLEALRPAEIAVAIRVLRDGEEIPRTFNMKPFRRLAVKQFFPSQFLPLQDNAAAAC